MVGRCKLIQVEARVERGLFQHLKLKYDNLRPSFALNLKLRPYIVVYPSQDHGAKKQWQAGAKLWNDLYQLQTKAGRCRLTLSNPR